MGAEGDVLFDGFQDFHRNVRTALDEATYNFFAGDAILLTAAILAFALAYALGRVPGVVGADEPRTFGGGAGRAASALAKRR